ncbi:MAG: murein biosynthesis integral membrane protein MurJ [Thermoanaerobaculia bacterium]
MTDEVTTGGEAAPRTRAGGYAFLVGAGIFLSRVAGLARGAVLANFLGTTEAASAFYAALRIPNFLQNLLGEGVLSASMIPVYSRLLAKDDRETAGKVAGTILSLLALVTAAVAVLGVLFAPLFVTLLTPGFVGETRRLTIVLVRILFPAIGLLVLSAWCLAVLNSHRKFFLPYAAPVLWNAAIIAAVLLFGRGESAERVAVIAGWGVLAGAILQLGIQVPSVAMLVRPLRLAIFTRLEAVRQVFRNFGPVLVGRGVVQISAFVDEILASYLTTAAIAGIGYAYTIYLLPFSLFGMAVSASELPQMASAAGTSEDVAAALRERLRRGLRQIAFFVVPSVVAFFAIGDDLVATLYQRRLFTADSTLYVWYILGGYAVGLLAGTLSRLYVSAFFALNDTRTPVRFAVVRVVLAAAIGLLLAFPLRPLLVRFLTGVLGLPVPALFDSDGVRLDGALALGAVGLSFASGVVSWIELGLLRRAMARRIGTVPFDASHQLKLWTAALAAGAAGFAVSRHLLPAVAPGLHPIPYGIASAAAFGIVYLTLALIFRIPEVTAITRRLGR